ncbi:uncharacterized protein N7469_000660 [Penicillium citrinum]|uniref:Galactose oxidase/kelch, beta-propeller n=2 Tax=Penicillium TaxID=5073 RepID=A0A9W9TV40_PENCI|nr:uncharacterized protein N7469_000660 [Penicillium citrinum]KAJ5242333.1 hypothetical protein N7469_000660 [Penicillium citrinum]KAJ5600174.1 hypothetical protein N7450_001241 [Penicillium hetheringtonii]
MKFHTRILLALLVFMLESAAAMCNAVQKQVNLTMCNWQGLRANILHDTIYIDGGSLWLQQGYDDGCVNQINDGNFRGYIYSFNLSTPFNDTSDFIAILDNSTIAGGAASNIAPNYIDGVMFSNQEEFYLYGGMMRSTNVTDEPADDTVLGYQAYQYNSDASMWAPKWFSEDLPSGVTRYITNGAGVSAPSENMGFYFSGMRSPDWGSFTYDDMESNTTADTLITVNMAEMGKGKWVNYTLPDYVAGRSKGELVWLPVSKSGVLVAIGGVVEPVEFWRTTDLNDQQISKSERTSPSFMETVTIYDVDSKAWYLQNTTGDIPPQLTQFCSVLASASDGSSHNIYIYGGYNGLEYDSNPSDDVHILSIPSFKWIKVYNGTSTHGRSGHRCIKIYPDQMFAIGGQHIDSTKCLEGGLLANFNLNKLVFEESYNPAKWSEYRVPGLITSQIGGDTSGGATTTAPSSWGNKSLESIFQTKYSKPITTYWPYGTSKGTTPQTKDHGLPTWAAAVIGVLCGLFGVGVILAAIWFYLRRRRGHGPLSSKPDNIHAIDNNEERKIMYASGPASPGPGPVSNSTGIETRTNDSMMQDSINTSISPRTVESGGGAVYEMHDSSPAELPTQFNVSSSYPTAAPPPPPPSSVPECDSPVSAQSPSESESGHSYQQGHHRRPSSLSILPSQSIDNVVTGRASYFQETFHQHGSQRVRHGSEISNTSLSADERERFGGNEAILEDEQRT